MFDEEKYAKKFREEYRKGYAEGQMIGSLEILMRLIESKTVSLSEAAKLFYMNEVELRAKLDLGFEEMEQNE